MKREFLSNFQVNGQPLPEAVIEAILAEHRRALAAQAQAAQPQAVRPDAARPDAARPDAAQAQAAQPDAVRPEAAPEDGREQALKAREARLDCREYLAERGLPAGLLDVLDTSDPERFRAALDALLAQLPALARGGQVPPPYSAGAGTGAAGPAGDPIAAAFRR